MKKIAVSLYDRLRANLLMAMVLTLSAGLMLIDAAQPVAAQSVDMAAATEAFSNGIMALIAALLQFIGDNIDTLGLAVVGLVAIPFTWKFAKSIMKDVGANLFGSGN